MMIVNTVLCAINALRAEIDAFCSQIENKTQKAGVVTLSILPPSPCVRHCVKHQTPKVCKMDSSTYQGTQNCRHNQTRKKGAAFKKKRDGLHNRIRKASKRCSIFFLVGGGVGEGEWGSSQNSVCHKNKKRKFISLLQMCEQTNSRPISLSVCSLLAARPYVSKNSPALGHPHALL